MTNLYRTRTKAERRKRDAGAVAFGERTLTKKRTSRPKKPKLPPSATPWPCVVLSVDTAERSGWAVYVRGELELWGEIDMLRPKRSTYSYYGMSGWDADRVCGSVVKCAELLELPAVLVYERPFRGTTQGQWIGAWKRAWVVNGGSMRRVLGCYPSTWRARVLGSGRLPRDRARALEARIAESLSGDKPGPDASASIAMGQWAIRAGEVGAKLPKQDGAILGLENKGCDFDPSPNAAGRRVVRG